jgi:hypothetical protein
MGFLLGGSCSPCCQAPVSDPCLGSCRPAGETRPLTAINVTLSAQEYRFSCDFLATTASGTKTFSYLFPGNRYNGTFALTPSATTPNVYEYRFAKCGGCSPTLQFWTGSRQCFLHVRLFGIFTVDGTAPVCATSTGAAIYLPPGIKLTSCGTRSVHVMNGDEVPLGFVSGYGWAFTLPRNLRKAVEDSATSHLNSAAFVVGGCDMDPVSGLPTSTTSFPQMTAITSTIAESGSFAVTLTNVSTTYG